jgi:hypothetical protein
MRGDITLTYGFVAGAIVLLLLLGATIAVGGIRFLEWTDERRAHKAMRAYVPPGREWLTLTGAHPESQVTAHFTIHPDGTMTRNVSVEHNGIVNKVTVLGDDVHARIRERLGTWGADPDAGAPDLLHPSTDTTEEKPHGH